MGRAAKKSRKRVKNKAHRVAPRIAAKPNTNLADSDESLLELPPEDDKDRRRRERLLIDRVYKARDLAKKRNPNLDTEAFVKELTAQFKRSLDQLEKKHPETDRLQLALYLTTPLDEQPLWFNPGKGEAMSQTERAKVINEFMIQKWKSGLRPSFVTRGSLFYRALKRQTRLTFKQWQVGHLTVRGRDIKEIAAELKISDRMVKTQLQAIRRKANLTRNAEIVRWFLGY
jgi:DNA-binding CsgD family transcriptional regulator